MNLKHPLLNFKSAGLLMVMIVAGLLAPATSAEGATTLREICRVKGQERINLHGFGIVTGLNGTGDGANFMPMIRSLGRVMELLGNPLGPGGLNELKDAKNVALVMVEVAIPASGATKGDEIDCTVSAIAAKSLAGGRLTMTPLVGPMPQENPPVFALAQGPITIDNEEMTTGGRVHLGCRLLEDVFSPYVENGHITLVVDKNYAGFQVAQEVADGINDWMGIQSSGALMAKALDQANIRVALPPVYNDDAVVFVSEILALEVVSFNVGPRVVIRERSGSIVFSGDVEIGPVCITHRNIVVEAGNIGGPFVGINSEDPENPKLKSLLEALNALQVPSEDKIEIIKALHRDGRLYAQLIIE